MILARTLRQPGAHHRSDTEVQGVLLDAHVGVGVSTPRPAFYAVADAGILWVLDLVDSSPEQRRRRRSVANLLVDAIFELCALQIMAKFSTPSAGP